MSDRPGIIERAFQVAQSGRVANITALKKQLRDEGYLAVQSYLGGAGLDRDLRRACLAARKPAPVISDGGLEEDRDPGPSSSALKAAC
jgi:hypothetical protein